MSSFNIIFSKLEKFTGDGHIDLRQWLRNFDRCCVIAEKSDDLVVGQILMLCVDGRAKAVLDQFEEEQGDPQKYSELKKQLNAVFDSDSDREAHMTAFERCVQRIGESEEEFMTHLLQLYKAADPQAKTNVINHAVKRKFLQGISDTLRRNIFIFCSNPYDEKVSHQDLLKASRDASVHLSLPSTVATAVPDAVLTAANPSDKTLEAVLSLSSKFEKQNQLAMRKFNEQQEQINAIKQQLPFRPSPQRGTSVFHFPRRSHEQPRRGFSRSFMGDSQMHPTQGRGRQPIRCYFCNGLNHIQRDCLAFRQQQASSQQSGNFWGPQ